MIIPPELIGHVRMCVRMKLRKDERDFHRRSSVITVDQSEKYLARIDRGQQILSHLREMERQDATK